MKTLENIIETLRINDLPPLYTTFAWTFIRTFQSIIRDLRSIFTQRIKRDGCVSGCGCSRGEVEFIVSEIVCKCMILINFYGIKWGEKWGRTQDKSPIHLSLSDFDPEIPYIRRDRRLRNATN